MQIRIARMAVIVFLANVAWGCTHSTGPEGSRDAELKVIHASPLVGAIDVQVGAARHVTGLAFGRSSGVLTVPSGIQLITVTSNGQTVAQFSANLSFTQRNALTVGSDTTQISPVTHDTGAVVSSRANLRLINVVGSSSAAPTLLQMRLRFPDVGDSVAVIGLDARIASHGPLMYFNPGQFSVQFVSSGSNQPVLAQAVFDVAAGQAKAIVLERAANGTYSVKIVVE